MAHAGGRVTTGGGNTFIDCHANANSINDDHADKSTNFEACKLAW